MRVAALILALGLVHPGCSYALVKGPPSPMTEPTECTDSLVLPVVDAVGAVAAGTFAGAIYFGLSQNESGPTEAYVYRQAVMAGFIVSLPWLLSGVYGLVQTRRCARLKKSRPR